MKPVVPVWAEEEVEIENESQAEEITEDGTSGMSDFDEVTDETEELPDIIMMTERSQSPVHRESGEMQKPTAVARIMMR